MNLQQRIELLIKLKTFIEEDNNEQWEAARTKASLTNPWFTSQFIDRAVKQITAFFLDEKKLKQWVYTYSIPEENNNPKTVGIVMAGNIPLVGFHDFLCAFITGNKSLIKLSSQDEVLLQFFTTKLNEWNSEISQLIKFATTLKNCDAYIATGSNNSSRYFEYYFAKYPHIIRRNRTSIAILEGNETKEELQNLSTDIQLYFGLGCRNVTKLYVPQQYDFMKLLEALKNYDYLIEFHKYKHNFDYQLALLIMNNKQYMNNGSILLSENASVFSAISHLHYEYYNNKEILIEQLSQNNNIQCIVAKEFIPFGKAQEPALTDYADGIDTIQFLLSLN
ncbi:MAG: acyl-CoA reductase [Bacteroidetes bacterium]|nr:acyl-CoA reductase [Bacteroidota bacterium]MBS1648254.1 acyl-CoA reductase [Bacteroidota bacterium]